MVEIKANDLQSISVMETTIEIKEPMERYQSDKSEGLKRFSEVHQKLRTPNCYLCSEAVNDRYVKVDSWGKDYDPLSNEMVFTAKCHGDTIELRRDLESLLKVKELDFRMVFKPKQGIRVNGKLVSIAPRKHELDQTWAY